MRVYRYMCVYIHNARISSKMVAESMSPHGGGGWGIDVGGLYGG